MRSKARALTTPRAGGRWAAIAATTMLLAGCSANDGDSASDDAPEPGGEGIAAPATCQADDDKRQMRGAWLTTVRNIDWPSEPGLSADEQKAELDAWLDDSVEMGLNAVFLHARPTADAVYDSELEPWARYLTGEQGGDPGYDPLEYAVEEAHERGLELHAWFNPYRVGLQDPDVENLADDHPVKENPEWLVDFGSEAYVDPGNPEVREWVTSVIMDVVDRYDVDGMHFDDFFYPYPQDGATFDDDASWEAHGDDFDDRGDWRRDNVDQLMRDVHGRIQETKPWVSFGVSPFGIWRNDNTDSSGSPSSGLQSYDAQYADTRTWIEEGTVDYIAPQLYWERGFDTADYEAMTDWWSNEVEGTDVDLYVGQGAYRLGEDGWTGDDALSNQLDYSGELDEVSGDIYFSIKNLRENGDVVDHLLDGHYSNAALPPVIENPEGEEPLVGAVNDVAAQSVDGGVEVAWNEIEDARFYALYRLSAEAAQALESGDEDAYCTALTADNLVGMTGGSLLTDNEPLEDGAGYVVTALDDYRAEGPVSEVADVRS
ncbi:glycoside hydrolase family 10 protein [Nocardiopsis sp. JB363]|uniref:glycoside hydrolase family 10 protein n=1 Tax=Nocardiopsis sp. JB363 TaxID=1434837 RepID=UPI00097A719E|nr:family 10 glycosylhydrolase [Nocardiopsis sp. JB363]SIO90265.1 COG1649 predicted glycoside hydrolase [Nocardiopsis sp. JB363]